jgi:hypothetical protein
MARALRHLDVVRDFGSRTTPSGVPRAARPDGVSDAGAYLIKFVAVLRLTYQIRLLTYAAAQHGSHLFVLVPTNSRISPRLQTFLEEQTSFVSLDRLDRAID